MNKKELLKLLKSGDFTIMYWDNAEPSLYKGKGYDVNNFPENLKEIETPFGDCGYLPDIVFALVKALGGEADSI